jgi:hypothetical protein
VLAVGGGGPGDARPSTHSGIAFGCGDGGVLGLLGCGDTCHTTCSSGIGGGVGGLTVGGATRLTSYSSRGPSHSSGGGLTGLKIEAGR